MREVSPDRPVEATRGLLLFVMILEHARFFLGPRVSSGDAETLFARVSDVDVPGLLFLAGAAAWTYVARGGQARRLAIAGLGLMLLELLVVRWVWLPAPWLGYTLLQLVFALGAVLLVLSLMVRLPSWLLFAGGVGLVVLSDLAPPALDGFAGALLFRTGLEDLGWLRLHALYPLVPWLGVVLMGASFGAVLARGPRARRHAGLLFGALGLGVFAALRAPQWSSGLALFAMEQHPPSVAFVALWLGALMLLLPLVEAARVGPRSPLVALGRAPVFAYVAHLLILRLVASLASAARWGWAESVSLDAQGHAHRADHPLWLCLVIGVLVAGLVIPWCRAWTSWRLRCDQRSERRIRPRALRPRALHLLGWLALGVMALAPSRLRTEYEPVGKGAVEQPLSLRLVERGTLRGAPHERFIALHARDGERVLQRVDVVRAGAPDAAVLFVLGNESPVTEDDLYGLRVRHPDLSLVVVEHRGYGESLSLEVDQSVPRYVTVAAALADAEAVASALQAQLEGPWIVAGWSYGGGLAVRFGATRPELVAGVYASSAALSYPRRLEPEASLRPLLGDDVVDAIAARLPSWSPSERDLVQGMMTGFVQMDSMAPHLASFQEVVRAEGDVVGFLRALDRDAFDSVWERELSAPLRLQTLTRERALALRPSRRTWIYQQCAELTAFAGGGVFTTAERDALGRCASLFGLAAPARGPDWREDLEVLGARGVPVVHVRAGRDPFLQTQPAAAEGAVVERGEGWALREAAWGLELRVPDGHHCPDRTRPDVARAAMRSILSRVAGPEPGG